MHLNSVETGKISLTICILLIYFEVYPLRNVESWNSMIFEGGISLILF